MTPAEKWLACVNAKLSSPIQAGTVEDERAYDAYVTGKSASEAASIVTELRSDAAAYRARQMNAELPEVTRDVLALKGGI